MRSTSMRAAIAVAVTTFGLTLAGASGATTVRPLALTHTADVGLCPYTKITTSVGPTYYQPGIETSHSITAVRFTNRGIYSCALWGVPAIQAVGGASNSPLGSAAVSLSMGMMPVRHVLKPGQSVSSIFGSKVYFSIETCHVATTTGIDVSLPGFTHWKFVPLALSVCSALPNTTTQLVVAGTHGV